ncbi:hypothetical protein ACH5RR_029544 [Cinchona calisaya]|uniref:Reverse transcriptase zinc-binding domain-containing protein n=1 Tax=Cinchona calisaya TaxID=153742 RepID=A0ABD2YT56_9GENT
MACRQWKFHQNLGGSLAATTIVLPNDLSIKQASSRVLGGVNQDKLIWHFTKNGNLSVGSTYHLIRDQTLNSTNTASGSHASRSLSWKRLWKLKVPRKIKVFQWKVCQNILPTTSKLKTRGINLDESNLELLAIELLRPDEPFAKWIHLLLMMPPSEDSHPLEYLECEEW